MKARLIVIATMLMTLPFKYGAATTPGSASNECSPERQAKAAKECKARGVNCDSCKSGIDYKKALAKAYQKEEDGDGSGKQWDVDSKHHASQLPVSKIQPGDDVQVKGPIAVEQGWGRRADLKSPSTPGPSIVVPKNLAPIIPIDTPVQFTAPNGETYNVPVKDYGPVGANSARVEVGPSFARTIGYPRGTIGTRGGLATMVIRVPAKR